MDQSVEDKKQKKSPKNFLTWELYEALEKKLGVLSDAEIKAIWRKSVEEMQRGKLANWDPVKRRIILKQRLPIL